MKKIDIVISIMLFFPFISLAEPEAYFTTSNYKLVEREGSESLVPVAGSSVITNRIVRAVEGAQKSIYIAVAHFNSDEIANALRNRVQRAEEENKELDVKVLIDEGDNPNISQGKVLSPFMPVRIKFYSFKFFHPKSKLMHHKMIIVDEKTLITGSFNWSQTAEKENFENLLVFNREEHSALVDSYIQRFNELWNLNRDKVASFKESLTSRNKIFLHFQPMSLSFAEIKELKSFAIKATDPGFFKNFSPEHDIYDKARKQGYSFF